MYCRRGVPGPGNVRGVIKKGVRLNTDLAAAELYADIGRYAAARPLYSAALKLPSTAAQETRAWRQLLAMARYEKDWERLSKLLDQAQSSMAAKRLRLGPSLAIERGYLLLEQGSYPEMQSVLEAAIEKYPAARRSGELRFYAGVACYFQKQEDAADAHWCWVQENIPDDHMARRCYIAAAREGMPYPNPELGGYAKQGLRGGSIPMIKAAYAEAKARSLELKRQR